MRCADGSWSYFIRRFDRAGHNGKLPVEDFAQLAGLSRETKYDFSMERLVNVLDTYCTFPAVEKVSLFKRCLFNFVVGNEDMHVKNFSLITRDGKVGLAPAYDYLSTTVAFLSIGKNPCPAMENLPGGFIPSADTPDALYPSHRPAPGSPDAVHCRPPGFSPQLLTHPC